MTTREQALAEQLKRKDRAILAGLAIGILVGIVFILTITAEPVWMDQAVAACQP